MTMKHVLGDLHMDPRDLDHSFEGREHFKEIFKATDNNKFVVSLGDLGSSLVKSSVSE